MATAALRVVSIICHPHPTNATTSPQVRPGGDQWRQIISQCCLFTSVKLSTHISRLIKAGDEHIHCWEVGIGNVDITEAFQRPLNTVPDNEIRDTQTREDQAYLTEKEWKGDGIGGGLAEKVGEPPIEVDSHGDSAQDHH